jgi:predicted alpha/beta-fold hydrolase
MGFPDSVFYHRFPWWNGDLQTLRDTFRPPKLPPDQGLPVLVPLPDGGALLAFHDPYPNPKGLVLLLHGLGGSSDREGLRRMGLALQTHGFAVLRLNLRGAGRGRPLAAGTYAALCNQDLAPVLNLARRLAAGKPLVGVGISLGGTILLNAALDHQLDQNDKPCLDALVCTSSPLDLGLCSASIERPRNRIYQHWLVKRLVKQTLEDPAGIKNKEKIALQTVTSIRDFDEVITAPRWGFCNAQSYYEQASPIHKIAALRLPSLLLQAFDDPWVTATTAKQLRDSQISPNLQVVLTKKGGHNGFHGKGDHPYACWGDLITAKWLKAVLLNQPFADYNTTD